MKEQIERIKADLAAYITNADPDHEHRWFVDVCAGRHAGPERWSGGTIGYDNWCRCGARVHLGY